MELDPQLMGLASIASQELVKVMVSDGWPRVRESVAGWFGRDDAQRAQRQAQQLEEARTALRGGQDPSIVAGRWQGRLENMIEEHPELGADLPRLVAQLREAAGSVAVTAAGARSIAAGATITGIASTGDGAINIQRAVSD